MNMDYPVMGHMMVLVYRECAEGCWCATGEGDVAPRCCNHELPMVPPQGLETAEDAQARRLGFAAVFGYEQGLLRRISKWRRKHGLQTYGKSGWAAGVYELRGAHRRRKRYFTPKETAFKEAK